MTKKIHLIIAAFALTQIVCVPAAVAESFAITGGIVHTLTEQGVMNGATVVIQDGKVTAVGRNIAIPDGAEIIDAQDKVVTPGFMTGHSNLGLREISLEDASLDYGLDGERFTAAFDVTDAINPRSTQVPINRIDGMTRAAVGPNYYASAFSEELDGALAGRGAVMHLGSSEDFIVRGRAAMYFIYGEDGASISGGARGGALLRLREALEDAHDYAANQAAWAQGRRRDYNLHRLDLEAMQPVLKRSIPLIAEVSRASDIEAMIRLAGEFNLRLAILNGDEAWMVAKKLAAVEAAVILNPLNNTPASFESIGSTLKNAALLQAAGVKIAFMNDTHNARNIRQNAGNAVAHGMTWEAALQALTINPAEIFGVQNYGRLAPGYDADVVIWDGDPMEVMTYAEQVFIKGQKISMESRSTKLLERYRDLNFNLPPAYRN